MNFPSAGEFTVGSPPGKFGSGWEQKGRYMNDGANYADQNPARKGIFLFYFQ
jgi:hypothetical protein